MVGKTISHYKIQDKIREGDSFMRKSTYYLGDYIDRLTRWDGTRVAGVC